MTDAAPEYTSGDATQAGPRLLVGSATRPYVRSVIERFILSLSSCQKMKSILKSVSKPLVRSSA